MPALRVMLVHAFPRFMGTSRTPTSNQYYAHNKQSGKSGNLSSAVGSQFGNASRDNKGGNGITFTKSFEVTHGRDGDDEESLVKMDELSSKGRVIGSSGSSEVSVSQATSPMPSPMPRTRPMPISPAVLR
jgi:hypothetical protein